MHYHQRALLIILCGLLCACIMLATCRCIGEARRDTEEVNNLIFTAKSNVYIKSRKLILNGTFSAGLGIEPDCYSLPVQDQQREQRLFFQDITISAPNRIGPKTYTFRVEAVHKFDSGYDGEMFSGCVSLRPATVNELTINKVGPANLSFH